MITIDKYFEDLKSAFAEIGIDGLVNMKIKDSSVIRILAVEEKQFLYVRYEDCETFLKIFKSENLETDSAAWDKLMQLMKTATDNRYFQP